MKNTGLSITGVFKGFNVKKGRPNAQGVVKETLQCGVEIYSEGDFGEVSEIFVLTVPQNLVSSGFPPKMSDLNGKLVTLPVTVREWEFNGRSGTTYSIASSASSLLDNGHIEVKTIKAA
jgi:hypothetical protein